MLFETTEDAEKAEGDKKSMNGQRENRKGS